MDEAVHGVVRLLTPSIRDIRTTFRFRYNVMLTQPDNLSSSYRNTFLEFAKQRLANVVAEYLQRVNDKRKKKKVTVKSLDIVGVHIRRTDHVQYEEGLGYSGVTRHYFIRAMDLYRENLRHPVFILVTDDEAWVEENIPRRLFSHFYTG